MKNPSQEGWLYFLVEKWRFLSAIIASLLMDLAFLLLWSLALFWYDKAVDYIDPTGAHSLIHIVKAIFELSTLAVVVVFTLADIARIIARIRAENRKELYAGKAVDKRELESRE